MSMPAELDPVELATPIRRRRRLTLAARHSAVPSVVDVSSRELPLRRWVMMMRAEGQAAAVTAAAEVFTVHQIEFESLVSTTNDQREPCVVAMVRCTAPAAERVATSLAKLTCMLGVQLRESTDPGVRANAVIQMPQRVAFTPPAFAQVQWQGNTAAGEPLRLSGPLAEIDSVVNAAQLAGAIWTSIVVCAV